MDVFARQRLKRVAETESRIREVLTEMRPLLGVESFAAELVRFDPATGVAHVRVAGDCPDCDMTAATLVQGIEAHLRMRVPQVVSVSAVASPS